MLTDPGSHAIVKAVVGLAHNLGMEVVGEGIESAAHLDALAELGCESVQGFHLSPPLTAEAATHMLTERAAAETGSAAPLLP
jgi:EAL domain-containing protein (putative c-di-GMP-specific phosphodiesterase class I)